MPAKAVEVNVPIAPVTAEPQACPLAVKMIRLSSAC